MIRRATNCSHSDLMLCSRCHVNMLRLHVISARITASQHVICGNLVLVPCHSLIAWVIDWEGTYVVLPVTCSSALILNVTMNLGALVSLIFFPALSTAFPQRPASGRYPLYVPAPMIHRTEFTVGSIDTKPSQYPRCGIIYAVCQCEDGMYPSLLYDDQALIRGSRGILRV